MPVDFEAITEDIEHVIDVARRLHRIVRHLGKEKITVDDNPDLTLNVTVETQNQWKAKAQLLLADLKATVGGLPG